MCGFATAAPKVLEVSGPVSVQFPTQHLQLVIHSDKFKLSLGRYFHMTPRGMNLSIESLEYYPQWVTHLELVMFCFAME